MITCDICNNRLIMQDGGSIAICENCGMQYSIERIKEKLQQSNNLSGNTISPGQIFQEKSSEFKSDTARLKKLIKKYYDSGDFRAAEQTAKKILEETPVDMEACQLYDELQTLKYLEIKNGVLIKYTGQVKSLTLPNCITKVGEFAFCGGHEGIRNQNKCLQQITIPNSVKEIDTAAFANCISLSQVNIAEGLYSIGDNAFAGCISLDRVNLPEGLCSIGNNAFAGCRALKSVTFPSTLNFIGERAFSMTNLNCIVFPESNIYIKGGAFSDCTSLRKVVLPKSIVKNRQKIFCNCIINDDYSSYEGACRDLSTIYIGNELILPVVKYRDLIIDCLYGTELHYRLRDIMEVYFVEKRCPHCGNNLRSKLFSRYCNHCDIYIEDIAHSAYYVDLPYNLGMSHYHKVTASPWFIELRSKGIV